MADPTACELIQRLADALETWQFGCGSTAADTCAIQAARAYLTRYSHQRPKPPSLAEEALQALDVELEGVTSQ